MLHDPFCWILQEPNKLPNLARGDEADAGNFSKKVAPPAVFSAGGAVFTPQMPLRGISRSPKGNGGNLEQRADYQ